MTEYTNQSSLIKEAILQQTNKFPYKNHFKHNISLHQPTLQHNLIKTKRDVKECNKVNDVKHVIK